MKYTQNKACLHARTCMHMQTGYFDHADRLGTSISIYHTNLNEFEQRIKKLILHFLCAKIPTHVHARACIFRKNDLRSTTLQTLDYHPGKFHIDPSSSF